MLRHSREDEISSAEERYLLLERVVAWVLHEAKNARLPRVISKQAAESHSRQTVLATFSAGAAGRVREGLQCEQVIRVLF
jgi:hypothetical protein